MVKLVLSSASNFTDNMLKVNSLDYLKYEIVYKDEHYLSTLEWTYPSKEDMIDYMKNDGLVTIAHPPIGEWIKEFNELLKEDRDMVCLLTSHNLGGACRAFNIVKNLIKTDRQVEALEVNGAGPCEELIAIKLIDFIKEDTTIEEIKSYFDSLNQNIHYYAISESMRQWAYTGRSNDKKTELVYPQGLPVMKGQPDGHIVPLGLCSDFDSALSRFREEIQGMKAESCVINYTFDTYTDWIDKFEQTVIDTLNCKVIAKNCHGSIVTCVEGVNSVDVAFI